jgi:DNA-binding CsgD family transcriptional regulator
VVYLAVGQSTKETAHALGISAATVRVLLSRASAKLKVRSREELLGHPDMRQLRPVAPRPLRA